MRGAPVRRVTARLAVLPFAALLACCAPALAAAGPVTAGTVTAGTVTAGDGECGVTPSPIPGTPWALQRLQLAQLWSGTSHQGQGVRVAVIDSGVDDKNPQLSTAVDASLGRDLTSKKGGNGTSDTEGHGTEVAGIIAARQLPKTGFIGIAPRAVIIPVRQNAGGNGKVSTLAQGINYAVSHGARVINISQDTTAPTSELAAAVQHAVAQQVVVVAAAGNDGANGKVNTTYPAAYQGVLAVGASDRNDERADFSQAGAFVGVVAPGVDMTSTVPGKGQCVDSGTSFSAPYVAGVAALLIERFPHWSAQRVIAQIEQTADRPSRGRTDALGWGVVDPVRAVTETSVAVYSPHPDPVATDPDPVRPVAYAVDDGSHERMVRDAVYALGTVILLIAVVAGGSVVLRDARRGRRR